MKLGTLLTSVLAFLIVTQPLSAGVLAPQDKIKYLERLGHDVHAGNPILASNKALARYDTVNFDFDLDVLDREAKKRIRRQAAFIRKSKNARFAVTGHTDKVGNPAYNMNLGLRRANRVLEELVRLGVDRKRLVAMVSMGEKDPLIDVETRERQNRRVTTRVMVKEKSALGQTGEVSKRHSEPKPDTTIADVSDSSAAGETSAEVSPDDTPSGGASDDSSATKETTTVVTRPGNSAEGTGRPDAGRGNGDEPSGDPEGSIGHNNGGDDSGGN